MSGIAVSVLVGAIALSALPLPAFGVTSIGDLVYTGERKDGTRLKFNATDQIVAQVDVGSGNLFVSVRGISLCAAKTKIQTGAFYDSIAVSSIGTGTRLGRGWRLDLTPPINIKVNADNSVTYTGRTERGVPAEIELDHRRAAAEVTSRTRRALGLTGLVAGTSKSSLERRGPSQRRRGGHHAG